MQRCFVVPNTDVEEKNCCSTEEIQNCKVYARNRFETIDLDYYHLYNEGRDIRVFRLEPYSVKSGNIV